MGTAAFTNSHDLIAALASSMNIISPVVANHHEQVAYLSYQIAREMGVEGRDLMRCVLAAALHDVGAIFTEKPADTLDFESNALELAQVGASIVGGLEPFGRIGTIIGHAQHVWTDLAQVADISEDLRKSAAIIHLADRVSICLVPDRTALDQEAMARAMVRGVRGIEFCPDVVDAFMRVADKPYVWMDLVYHAGDFADRLGTPQPISLGEVVEGTRLVSRLIDFRSPFTAMHSAGVRASAVRLAQLMGMSERECLMMSIAGNLHDLGKIHVPREILEKPGKLDDAEFNVIQEHAYYTYRILQRIEGFGQICDWAALHHEKLNGRGYPFRLTSPQIGLGSRIMAVADIFSAVAEERPYRKGMEREAIERVMRQNVESGATCGFVTAVLLHNFDDVNEARDRASREAGARYFATLERSKDVR